MKTKAVCLFLAAFYTCNVASAGSALTAQARSILVDIDKIERKAKPFLGTKAPAGASARYRSAWRNVVRKAEKVYYCCKPVRLYAQKIVKGNQSKETINMLRKMLHKLYLAINAFSAAVEKLERVTMNTKPEAPPIQPTQ